MGWKDEKHVQWDLADYPADSCACRVRFLSDTTINMCLSALRSAHWWKKWRGVTGEDDPNFEAGEELVDTAENELMSDCSALSTALQAIADAMRVSGSGGEGCGGMWNCLDTYTDDQLLDTPPDPVDPMGETPPDGFATMELYLAYKCKSAHAIIDALKGFATGLQSLSLTAVASSTVGPLVIALLSSLGVITLAFPPGAVVALIAAIVAAGALSAFVFVAGIELSNYLETNRATLACELYKSGSADEALTAIANVVEDFVQAYTWGATGAGELFATVIAAFQTNSLVMPLFRLVEDLTYPEVDCSGCGLGDCEPVLWDFTSSDEGFDELTSTPAGRFTGSWTGGHLTYSGTSQNGQNAVTWTKDGMTNVIKPEAFIHADVHVDSCQTTGPSYYLYATGPDLFASTYTRPDTTGTFHLELDLASAEGKELTTIILQCTDNVSGNPALWEGYWDNLEVCV